MQRIAAIADRAALVSLRAVLAMNAVAFASFLMALAIGMGALPSAQGPAAGRPPFVSMSAASIPGAAAASFAPAPSAF